MSYRLILLCCLLAFSSLHAQNAEGHLIRERLSFDKDWLFYAGDIPFPVIKGHENSYMNAKAGRAGGAAAPDFSDSQWRTVTLPHDWAVEGGFDSSENLSQGYRHRGIGWYRKHFKLDSADAGKQLELQFGAIATHATVWINGTVVHRNWCGYTSFTIDITALARYGTQENTIAIRVDANDMEGWWYEGAGIYRHVWLMKRSPVHIATDGIFAQPVRRSQGNWSIPAEVTLENSGDRTAFVNTAVTVLDNQGRTIAQKNTSVSVNALGQTVVQLAIPVSNPGLWTLETPVLYKVKAEITRNGQRIDTAAISCGFRTIRFTADSGFYLNGKRLKIQGVCNHQDHAGVGVAVPDALWDFRLRRLKEMGANAYRCAHNPPAEEFLEACDRAGILVMDENRNFNSSPEYIRQLQWMIRRDRNHPSVILWSVFNEEPMQGTPVGYEMVRRMRATVKALDTTRPVTAAMSGGYFEKTNVSQTVDVVGFNYNPDSYDRFHKENPHLPLTSSEDVSAFMTRGEYADDTVRHIIESYDTRCADWGSLHRTSWKTIDTRPYLGGCFVWTGFDYRGEPSPYRWPSAGSFFGAMDQCGFAKTAYYIYQALWIKNKPVLSLAPHWNWPSDSIGKPIRVMAMTNTDSVVILLNGAVVAAGKTDKYEMNTWKIPYAPGTLEAIGFQNKKEVVRYRVETTGKPYRLELVPDRASLTGDGKDAIPVTICVLDEKGRPVPTANFPVEFTLKGPGAIIGLGNGDPNSHEPEKGNKRSLFNGLAQLIVQSKDNTTGPIAITVASPGIEPFTLKIEVHK